MATAMIALDPGLVNIGYVCSIIPDDSSQAESIAGTVDSGILGMDIFKFDMTSTMDAVDLFCNMMFNHLRCITGMLCGSVLVKRLCICSEKQPSPHNATVNNYSYSVNMCMEMLLLGKLSSYARSMYYPHLILGETLHIISLNVATVSSVLSCNPKSRSVLATGSLVSDACREHPSKIDFAQVSSSLEYLLTFDEGIGKEVYEAFLIPDKPLPVKKRKDKKAATRDRLNALILLRNAFRDGKVKDDSLEISLVKKALFKYPIPSCADSVDEFSIHAIDAIMVGIIVLYKVMDYTSEYKIKSN